jgi:hypothetical protein
MKFLVIQKIKRDLRKMGEAASVAVQVFRKVGEREDY